MKWLEVNQWIRLNLKNGTIRRLERELRINKTPDNLNKMSRRNNLIIYLLLTHHEFIVTHERQDMSLLSRNFQWNHDQKKILEVNVNCIVDFTDVLHHEYAKKV